MTKCILEKDITLIIKFYIYMRWTLVKEGGYNKDIMAFITCDFVPVKGCLGKRLSVFTLRRKTIIKKLCLFLPHKDRHKISCNKGTHKSVISNLSVMIMVYDLVFDNLLFRRCGNRDTFYVLIYIFVCICSSTY